jgi:hypothetical protein
MALFFSAFLFPYVTRRLWGWFTVWLLYDLLILILVVLVTNEREANAYLQGFNLFVGLPLFVWAAFTANKAATRKFLSNGWKVSSDTPDDVWLWFQKKWGLPNSARQNTNPSLTSTPEFEQQRQAPAKVEKVASSQPLWMRILLVIFGLIVVFIFVGRLLVKGESEAGLPTCESSRARDAVKRAIENNVDSRQINLHLLDMGQVGEVSFSKEKPERICTAVVTLNSGAGNIRYRLWLGSQKGTFLVEVNEY